MTTTNDTNRSMRTSASSASWATSRTSAWPASSPSTPVRTPDRTMRACVQCCSFDGYYMPTSPTHIKTLCCNIYQPHDPHPHNHTQGRSAWARWCSRRRTCYRTSRSAPRAAATPSTPSSLTSPWTRTGGWAGHLRFSRYAARIRARRPPSPLLNFLYTFVHHHHRDDSTKRVRNPSEKAQGQLPYNPPRVRTIHFRLYFYMHILPLFRVGVAKIDICVIK